MLDGAIASKLLLNKDLTYRWLAAKGLRTPAYASFGLGSIQAAEEFMLAHPGPAVVKPADGTGCGHGVTTNIADHATLRDAATHAAAFHSSLLIEQQLSGSSYRLLFLEGRFLDAVRRDPPMLTGDGRSSIRELAQQENDRRREGAQVTALSPLILDRESSNTLARAGMSPASVPGEGDRVRVKLAVNENSASENHVVREQVHPEIVETCRRIAGDFGLGLAGFDLMSDDISLPPNEGATAFAEINTGPGLHHHYLVAEVGRITPVAEIILDHLFAAQRGVFAL
jgi:cyanophycin synthetase